MWLKFRKRITVFPWFKLNLSKSWISSTLWIKWLNVNFNKTWSYLNLGLPWSWIYDRIKISNNENWNISNEIDFNNVETLGNEIKSLDIWKMSDEIWEQIKSDIKESFKQRKQLKKDIFIIKVKLFFLWVIYYIYLWFLIKKYKKYYNESKLLLNELKSVYNNCNVNLDFNFDTESEKLFSELKESFTSLLEVKKVWDITSARWNDGISDRSWASSLLTREVSGITETELDFIKTNNKTFKFINKNWGDIFIYPWYIIIKKGEELDIFDIRKLKLDYYRSRFIEEEKVFDDTTILDYTWKYVNKTWTQDKRYKDNFQIPIAEYWNLLFESNTWMCEEFSFSSSDLAMNFWERLFNYINYISNWENISQIESANFLEEDNIDDYTVLKCENWKTINTQSDNDFFNKLESEKEKVYDFYWKLTVENEEIKQFWDKNKMIIFEDKVHKYFNNELFPNFLKLWFIESVEPIKNKIEYDERDVNTYTYIGKEINIVEFEEIKEILDNRLKFYKQWASEYVYDLYAKSLRRIWNYYKKEKMWEKAQNIFTIIDNIGFSGIRDKNSLIKIKKELS